MLLDAAWDFAVVTEMKGIAHKYNKVHKYKLSEIYGILGIIYSDRLLF